MLIRVFDAIALPEMFGELGEQVLLHHGDDVVDAVEMLIEAGTIDARRSAAVPRDGLFRCRGAAGILQ